MILVYFKLINPILAFTLSACLVPAQASSSSWNEARKIIEGNDVDKQIELMHSFKKGDLKAIPDDVQILLIQKYIENYNRYYKHPNIFLRLFNRSIIKEKEKYIVEATDVIDSFYQPNTLESLVINRGPSAKLVDTYKAQLMPILLSNIGILLSDSSYYVRFCAAIRTYLAHENTSIPLMKAEDKSMVRDVLRNKLEELMEKNYPCKYPERPESIIETLIALNDSEGKKQGDKLIAKCICRAPRLFDQVAHFETAYINNLSMSSKYADKLLEAIPNKEIRSELIDLFEKVRAGNEKGVRLNRELGNMLQEDAIECGNRQ